MSRSSKRGFTLLELLVAATIASVVILGAFVALQRVQSESIRQRRSVDVIAPARRALDLVGRDIRMAGDSATLFGDESYRCLGAINPLATLRCPAVLDAHPWRITLARNAWGLDEKFTDEDDLPIGALLEQNPRNVVTYQFEPVRVTNLRYDGENRRVAIGRLVRIQNPFGFLGEEPQRTVLLDNVLLDDAMKVDPASGAKDPRFDHALFMYHLFGRSTEFDGDPAITERTTSEKDLAGTSIFITPPMVFFDPLGFPGGLPAASAATGYTADYGMGSVRGLSLPLGGAVTTRQQVFAASLGGADAWNPVNPDSDIRWILDQNRIRFVRVAFKVFDPQEDPRRHDGLDLDGDPTNGTSALYALESTFEIRALSGDRSGF